MAQTRGAFEKPIVEMTAGGRSARSKILLFFILLIAHVGCGTPQDPSGPHTPKNSESWYGAYLGGHKIGYLRQMTSQTPEGLIRMYAENFISAKTLDHPITLRMVETLEATQDYVPEKYFQKMDAGIGNPYIVRGKRQGERFHIVVESGGHVLKTKDFSIRELTFPQLADQLIRTENMAVGKSWTFQIINPADFLPIHIVISVDDTTTLIVAGKPKNVFRVTAKMGAIEMISFVDTMEADPYRIEMPAMGLEYVREDKSTAVELSAGELSHLDLAYFSAITPTGRVPISEAAKEVRVRLYGAPLEGLDLAGDFQIVEKSSAKEALLGIRRPDVSHLEDTVGGDNPADSQAGASSVKAELLRVARQLKRPAPLDFSRGAVAWMQKNIRQIPTSIVPDGAEVLEIGQGDCNEFSALFHAISRAAGFPCKIVSGVVCMDGRYFYHSWNEIRVGNRWIPVDSILNEVPASARHIKLIEGDFSASWKLAGVIRTLKIEVLTAR